MVSVKDSQDMVDRYMKRESNYQALKDRVLTQERELEGLDKERGELLDRMRGQRQQLEGSQESETVLLA